MTSVLSSPLSAEPQSLTVVVPLDTPPIRLDQFLAQQTPISRTRIQVLLSQGYVSENGQPVGDAARRVRSGLTYHITLPPLQEHTVVPETMDLSIIHEDEDVLVIHKPAGWVVHPAPGHATGTLVHGLLAHCGESLSGIGGLRRPGIVHRLDKGTSGLLIVAKHDVAHQGLSAQFADRTLSRVYQAIVWGRPVPQGTINEPIGRHPHHRQKQAVTPQGRPSVTHFRVVAPLYEEEITLVECQLETGRTHQIRVHLQHTGHPIWGDPAYGCTSSRIPRTLRDMAQAWPKERPALHAACLKFIHPRSGASLSFSAPLPEDMKTLIKDLSILDKREQAEAFGLF